ncbi:hypothetical protein [Desulfovibrio sp.]|uniref:hypothetical protein n=1 Tax=Desulfovibrio sp. TaxID=885 RepID=UPI0025C4E4CC|nr:hypothetical protein [Desulfovibrio sp.]
MASSLCMAAFEAPTQKRAEHPAGSCGADEKCLGQPSLKCRPRKAEFFLAARRKTEIGRSCIEIPQGRFSLCNATARKKAVLRQAV